ncbi:MAG TPA: hypothetical protein VFX60_10120 [Micromonospora sp.]|nr:hypothetical protein [Micromonospora sp.]
MLGTVDEPACDAFDAWLMRACPHELMKQVSEGVSNWAGLLELFESRARIEDEVVLDLAGHSDAGGSVRRRGVPGSAIRDLNRTTSPGTSGTPWVRSCMLPAMMTPSRNRLGVPFVQGEC